MKILVVRSKGAGQYRGIGEFARLKAVSSLLADESDIVYAEGTTRGVGGLRPFIATSLRSRSFRKSLVKLREKHPVMRTCIKDVVLPDDFQPDVVLSTLGPKIAPGALLATMYSAQWVHLGDMPRYWDYLYSAKVLTANRQTPKASEQNTIRLDFLPTRARMKPCDRQKTTGGPLATLVIGGSVNHLGYHYREEDFVRLFQGAKSLSDRFGVRWLLSTSTRTRRDREIFLQDLVGKLDLPIERVTWYCEKPEKTLAEFLQQSDLAFVTEDSRTMVSDAVASGVPAFSIRPGEAKPIKIGHDSFMEHLVERQYLRRITFSDLGALDLIDTLERDFTPIQQCWSEKFRSDIVPLLDRPSRLAS